MVLAATNRPSELDEAILRRFPQTFEIGRPDQSERSKILQVILKGEKIDEDIDYDNIARLCEGFTGSDIFELCKHAAYIPVREFLQAEKDGESYNGPRALKQSDLEKAMSTIGRKDKRSSSQSPPWAQPADSDDTQVQNAIFQISKIMSHIMNNQSEAHDP
ncbi:ATPase family AAA domain-containing protein 1-B [Dendrobium catenatum]|uniref:ATPase family AAA domain-containing protein 1-B n=1 Tax=Dendrobium catenatum TaxID=906689 RepID=UPI00109F176E|nr:ATPase family AAA domain-containing protein 1-B [Dendrobium catenatum]